MIITFENVPLTLKSYKCGFINMQECEGLGVIVESWYCLGSLEAMLLQFNSVTVTILRKVSYLFAPTLLWLSFLESRIMSCRAVKGYMHNINNRWSWIVTEYIASLLTPNVIISTSWHLMAMIQDNKDAIGHYDIELEKYQL